jgi:hypothetical protein
LGRSKRRGTAHSVPHDYGEHYDLIESGAATMAKFSRGARHFPSETRPGDRGAGPLRGEKALKTIFSVM